MAGEFLETTVGDVCQVFDGPHATPTRLDSGPVFLGITSLSKGRIDLSSSDHLSEEEFVKWTRRVTPRQGDVVFSYETRLGEAAIIPEGLRCCLGRRMGLMRPDPQKLDSRFLLYYYLGPEFQNVIRERTIHGSTVERIALIEFPKFPLRIPPLPTQRAIASVLGSLDDLIELNRETNEILEEMAQALFKSWFVDFDPVRAKLEGRPPAGMDAATAALFPDHFQDSELGQIPKGWEVKTADEISTVGIGKTPPRMEQHWFSENPSDVPWMSIRDLGNADVFVSRTSEFLTAEAVEKFRVKRIPDDTVVLSFKLTMGRVAITEGEMLSNEAIAHFRLNPEASFGSAFLYCYLKCFDYSQLGSTSSIATAINSDGVRSIPILVPQKDIAVAFERAVKPLLYLIRAGSNESRDLATLRDTLLPKLLSGELSVAEMAKEVSA